MYPIGSGPSVSIVSPVAMISRFHEIIFQVPKSAAVFAIALPSNGFRTSLSVQRDDCANASCAIRNRDLPSLMKRRCGKKWSPLDCPPRKDDDACSDEASDG